MKLTKDARDFLFHCLIMDDVNPNSLGRYSDDDLIKYWTKTCNEELPIDWVE